MTSSKPSVAVERLASIGDPYCRESSYYNEVERLKSGFGEDDLAWTYHTCTQLGLFQTTDQRDNLFGSHIPLRYFVQLCRDLFGTWFSRKTVKAGIEYTNWQYSDLNSSLTNVLFVNGENDPWRPLSVPKDLNPSTRTLVIKGAAHCAEMYPSQVPEVKKAQQEIMRTIGTFL